jgi:hypothetical protein
LYETLIARLTLDDIHHILSYRGQGHHIETPNPGTVLLGSLSWANSSGSQFNPFSTISLSDPQNVDTGSWNYGTTAWGASFPFDGGLLFSHGWTRFGFAFVSPENPTQQLHT